MGWNPYTDQKNRAYSGLLCSLFPEQTKSLTRILVWGVIFLLDLIAVIGGAFYLGLLPGGKLTTLLLVASVIGLFWLQGKVWYGIAHYLQKKNELD